MKTSSSQEVYYHRSPWYNRESILQHGLLIKYCRTPFPQPAPCIWLSDDVTMIDLNVNGRDVYAVTLPDKSELVIWEGVWWPIDLHRFSALHLVKDRAIYFADIPPANIELVALGEPQSDSMPYGVPHGSIPPVNVVIPTWPQPAYIQTPDLTQESNSSSETQ